MQDDLKETIDRELRDRSQSVLVFIHRCWCDWSRTNWAQNNWLKSSTLTSLDHSWFPGLFVFRAAPWEQNSSWALQSIAINSKQSFKTCNMLSEELVTSCLPVFVLQPVVEYTQSYINYPASSLTPRYYWTTAWAPATFLMKISDTLAAKATFLPHQNSTYCQVSCFRAHKGCSEVNSDQGLFSKRQSVSRSSIKVEASFPKRKYRRPWLGAIVAGRTISCAERRVDWQTKKI